MKFQVKVDQKLCTGCASCVAIAPDTFELNNKGKSVIRPGGKEDSKEKMLTAAQCCPSNAIIVEEVNSKEKKVKKIWPV